MKITKKAIDNYLKQFKSELTYNANDIPIVWETYNNTNVFSVEDGVIVIKKKMTFRKLINVLIKELKDNFQYYVIDEELISSNEDLESCDFDSVLDFEKIGLFVKNTLLQVKDK